MGSLGNKETPAAMGMPDFPESLMMNVSSELFDVLDRVFEFEWFLG